MDGPVVPDTSVVIKWFRQGEVLADLALALRDAYLDGQITISAPSLLAYELANVLRYKGDLTTGQVQDAVQSLFDMRLEWVLPSSTVMRRAYKRDDSLRCRFRCSGGGVGGNLCHSR